MDEILKSEIFIVVYGKKEGVSFEEFGGLFRQVHGYYLNLSNYGYSSLRNLLNDMKDLVELHTINRQAIIRCKSPARHHVVVSNESNSSKTMDQDSGLSSKDLPSSGPYPGPVVRKIGQAQPSLLQQKHVKVNCTNSATEKKSKESSKSKYFLPSKNTDLAVSHANVQPPVKLKFSLNAGTVKNERTAKNSKTTKSDGSSANLKPLTSNPTHAKPTENVAPAENATQINNVCKKRQISNSTSLNPITTGPNKKEGLLPTLKYPFKGNPIDFRYKSQIATPGVQSNMSYASVCKSNLNRNQFNQNGQQFTSNNMSFNVNTKVYSTNVPQSNSRGDSRTTTQSSSIIKENIQTLLKQHANGLSIFQLQKIYLFSFRHPLKFKGSTTVKQLLQELKDVAKIEGVGVQMLVFPVPAENSPNTAANGDNDAALQAAGSLFTKKDSKNEVVLNPQSLGFLKTQNDKPQQAAQLPLHDDPILGAEQHQTDSIKGHVTEVVKIEKTHQIMQKVQNTHCNSHYVESPQEEPSVPTSDAGVIPNHINEKTQYGAPPRVQMHHQVFKSHGQEKMSYLHTDLILKKTITKNGPSQNAPQDYNSPQVILHTSGFSLVMGQQMNGPDNKAMETDLADAINSLTEQKTYDSSEMLKGLEHSQQILSDLNSSMLLQDTKPLSKTHQLSVLHVEKEQQDTEHLKRQCSKKTMDTHGQTESPSLQSKRNLQTADDCNMIQYPLSLSGDSLQGKNVHVQVEKSSSTQKKLDSQNGKKVEQAAYPSLNSQEKTFDSQILNNINVSSALSFNERAPDVPSKNVIEKTSQHGASISTPTNVLVASAHDLFVHSTEQAVPMSSDAQKAINICTSERKQNKSPLPTKGLDEYASFERNGQTNISSSKLNEEIVHPPKNTPKQPPISGAQSELQNNLQSLSEQENVNTWQTSQGQVCCIL
ncbi:uncharacterized protein LOC142661472 [Rhinoderma darwinii]|uniref:uncharacterized protein LOC142661472 n=1 Tax=Rhinoderma darwinii TaxID=43563 RepID=UPI003F66B56C